MREVKQRRTSGLSRRRQYETSKSDRDTRLNRGQHEGDFSKKQGYAVIIIVLLVAGFIAGAWALDKRNPLFHSYVGGGQDPYTLQWHDAGSLTTNGGFNCISSVVCHGVAGKPRLVLASANTMQASVALSNAPIDLSTLSAKEALFQNTWQLTSSSFTIGSTFGWFLRINGTLPTELNYNPMNDKGVAMFQQFTTQSTDSIGSNLFINRNIGAASILSQSVGGCDPAGSAFICSTVTSTHFVSGSLGIDTNVFLNFTGQGSNTSTCSSTVVGGLLFNLNGPNCSWVAFTDNVVPTTNVTSISIVPPLNFQSQQYYVGYFMQGNLYSTVTDGVLWFFDNPGGVDGLGNIAGLQSTDVMAIYTFIPASGSSTTSPTDTGGWFGAVGRFLAPVGNFLTGVGSSIWGAISNPLSGLAGAFMNGIDTAISILATVVRATLNVIGNFFGLGNVGDDVINFFNGIANWLVNVFGGIISQIGNIANGFSSGVTGLQNLFIGWGAFLVSSLGVLGNLPTILLTVWNDVLPAAYAISFIVILWWVFGTYQAWRDFESGDFIAVLPVIGMTFTLLLWLGSSVAFNPISANTTVTNAYNTAFNQVSWFLTILIPIFLVMMFGEMGSNTERRGHKSLEHFNVWLSITNIVFLKIYNISFLIAKESWGMILTIKQLVSGWL